MTGIVRMTKSTKTETEIAILQVQVKNIEEKVGEIKNDVKELKDEMIASNTEIKTFLKEMKEEDDQAHRKLGEKISALENWRWMIVGAILLLGAVGIDTIKLIFRS